MFPILFVDSFAEAALYVVVGLGGSVLLGQWLPFPYYLAPVVLCLIASVVMMGRREQKTQEDRETYDEWKRRLNDREPR